MSSVRASVLGRILRQSKVFQDYDPDLIALPESDDEDEVDTASAAFDF